MGLLILAALAKYNSSIYNRSYEQDEKVSTASSYRTNSLNYCWSLNIVYNINDDKFGIEDMDLGGSDMVWKDLNILKFRNTKTNLNIVCKTAQLLKSLG